MQRRRRHTTSRSLPRLLAAVLLPLVLLVFAGAPRALAEGAGGDGHGGSGIIVLDQLDTMQRRRARSIFNEIICKCPRENWSKTLLNCPDGCSDQQKQEILHQIQDGWDDQRIIDYQVNTWGPLAHGKPDDALTYLLPALCLVLAAGVVWTVFRRWRGSAAEAQAQRRLATPAADDELAAVERELEELS